MTNPQTRFDLNRLIKKMHLELGPESFRNCNIRLLAHSSFVYRVGAQVVETIFALITISMQGLRIAHAYEVLGISHNASTEEITRAFKKLALKHHPDKSGCPQASEMFIQIKEAYETLIPREELYTRHIDAEEDPNESRDADAKEDSTAEDSTAASAKRAAAWLQPEYVPTFEVAYPGEKWYPVSEEISKEMYTAYLLNTPGHYTEPLTAKGKGGTREYIVDWQQMIQTNTANQRQRSVRFRGLQQDDSRSILTGKMRKS